MNSALREPNCGVITEGNADMEETDVHRVKAAAGDMAIGAGARIVVPVPWGRQRAVPERDEVDLQPRPRGRIPRIARLLALAHHFQHLLDTRVVASQTELARLAKISTARCTQIMNLLVLAPDIQEEILFLAPVCKGRAAITKKKLKPVLATLVWDEQRRRWAEVKQRQL